MWILGLSAFLGNIFVLMWRLKTKTKTVQDIFVGNLALSDLLMGVYMLLLAGADAYYGAEFYKFSDDWRASIPCRVASVFTLLSGETSLLLLTFITIDRFMCLVFPFSRKQFKKFSATVVVAGIWCVTLPLSLTASILANPDSDFYELSDVCIGLPLVTRTSRAEVMSSEKQSSIISRMFDADSSGSNKSWYFSIIVFLGVNSALSVTIFVLYIIIVLSVIRARWTAHVTKIKQEIMMALRMIALALTNCFCWIPVIILSILSQTEIISVSLDMYVWSVVFILPINPSLNPYLYTISALIPFLNKNQKDEEQDEEEQNVDDQLEQREEEIDMVVFSKAMEICNDDDGDIMECVTNNK